MVQTKSKPKNGRLNRASNHLPSGTLDDIFGLRCWLPFKRFWHQIAMQVVMRVQTSLPTQYRVRTPAEPMPPPIKEPPNPDENPDAPVKEPEPDEPPEI